MILKKEQMAYNVMLVLGVIILIVGAILANVDGFNNWIGGAWIGISAIKLHQIRKKPEKIEEQIVGLHDERNIPIRGNAGYMTFRITLFSLVLAAVMF